MFQFDQQCIIICATTVFIYIVTLVVNPFFLSLFRKKPHREKKEGTNCGPVSVVIYVEKGEAKKLENRLPIYLKQTYDGEYQLVIVYERGDGETEDVLKRNAGNTLLYSTFIPKVTLGVSKRELALTIGIKAAKHNNIILTDIRCTPRGATWLNAMASACDDTADMAVAAAVYPDNSSLKQRFTRIHAACCMINGMKRKRPFITTGFVIAIKKDFFLAQHSFKGVINIPRKGYGFNITWTKALDMTITLCDNDGWVTEDIPYPEERQRYSFLFPSPFRLTDAMSTILMIMTLILSSTFLALTSNWIPLAAVTAAAVIVTSLRGIFIKKAFHYFNT